MNALAGLRSLFRGVLLARPMTGVLLARPMTVPGSFRASKAAGARLWASPPAFVQAPSPFDFLFGAQWRGLKTYKLKTHKGAAKRLFPVGNGKTVKHERAGKQHLVRSMDFSRE